MQKSETTPYLSPQQVSTQSGLRTFEASAGKSRTYTGTSRHRQKLPK
jgi:hypothetical protein